MKFSPSVFSLFVLAVAGMSAVSAADEVFNANSLRGGRNLEDDGENGVKW